MCYLCLAQGLRPASDASHLSVAGSSADLQHKTSAFTTGPDHVSALLFGYSWSSTFNQSAVVDYTFDSSVFSGQKLPLETQRAAISAMQAYSNVANINFSRGGGNSELAFTQEALPEDSDGEVLGIAYTFSSLTSISQVEVQLDTDYTTDKAAIGQLGYQVMMHEIGHAIGLKHPFDSESGTGTTLEGDYDSWDYTVMSYTAGTNVSENNYATGLMVLDIAAAQYLYGANMTYKAGNDSYLIDGSAQAFAIWDAGGTDSIYAGLNTGDALINLNNTITTEETFVISHIGQSVFSPALGVNIEFVRAAQGNDTIIGSSGINTLQGHLGSDSIYGGASGDVLFGGQGIVDLLDSADTIAGDAGLDLIYGNSGNDQLFGDIFIDLTAEEDTTDGGDDTTDDEETTDDSYVPLPEADTIYGGYGQDTILGDLGDDKLYGGGSAGDPKDLGDLIYGGLGEDTLLGNGGNDTIYGGRASSDTEDGEDEIHGGYGNDLIYGNAGVDIIWAGPGNDGIYGGSGNDLFVFYHGSGVDSIYQFENPGGNEGDTIYVYEYINGLSIDSPADLLSRITYSGTRAELDLGGSNKVIIYGLGEAQLTVNDFFVFGL